MRRAAAQQGARRGVGGRTGGQNIVDEDDPPAFEPRLRLGGDAEGPLDIVRPLRAREADLRLRRFARTHPSGATT